MEKYYNLFYVGNMQNALNKPYTDKLPQMISFAKTRNNDYMDFDNPEYRVHKHDHLEIFYFVSGKGYFETKNVKIPIKEDTLIVVNANVMHRQYSTKKPPLIFYNINFSSLYLENLPDNCISNNDFEIMEFDGKKNKILKIFSLIQKETSQNDSTFLSIQSKAFILLDEITKLFQTNKNDKKKKNRNLLLDEIYLYLSDNYEIKITLDELSKRFFISKSRLSHEFKKEYGVSPIDYLVNVRLEKAETLLTKTDKSVVDVAFECGFTSSNYFSDHFKKRYGESPTKYRKSKKQQKDNIV